MFKPQIASTGSAERLLGQSGITSRQLDPMWSTERLLGNPWMFRPQIASTGSAERLLGQSGITSRQLDPMWSTGSGGPAIVR